MSSVPRRKWTESVVFGVLTLPVAVLLIAILLFNQTPSPAELRISGIIMSLAVLANLILDVASSGWLAAIRPVHIASAGIIYWVLLDMIQLLYEINEPSGTIIEAFLCIATFTAALQLVNRQRPFTVALRVVSQDCSLSRIFLAAVGSFVIASSYYCFRAHWDFGAIASGLMVGRGATPWSRGAIGDAWAAFEFLTYFLFLMPSLLVLALRTTARWFDVRILVIAALTALALLEIGSSGSRRDLGLALAASIPLILLTSKKARLRRRISYPVLALVGLLLIAILLSLNILLATRGNWRDLAVDSRDVQGIFVDDNFLRLCQTVEAVPQDAPYAGIQPVYFALVRPIPRLLWPQKPTDPGFTVHGFLGIGKKISLSNSVIGELYSSYGFAAIALGGFAYGLLCRLWEQKVNPWRGTATALIYCVGCLTLLNGIRSMNDLVVYSYPTICAMLLMPILTDRGPRRKLQRTK
jgi:hypothetical protein